MELTSTTPVPDHFRGEFRLDADARAVYSEAAGIGHAIPRAVAVPVDVEDVVTLVKWAAANRTPLIPRGSGSSMAGGAIGDGIILDLSALAWIDEVDVSSQSVRCGPGALRDDVDAKAREQGLMFPVDPSSGAYCTVGGMASTNSAGAHTLRYGAMREWVNSLDCIFSDGTRATVSDTISSQGSPALERISQFARELLERPEVGATRHADVRKNSSGYGIARYVESGRPTHLIVGSEGTLVVIVGLALRLTPAPAATASVLGAFPSLESAVDAAVLASESQASTCELLDRTFLDVARSGGVQVPASVESEAILLAEVEDESAERCAERAGVIERAFREQGATEVVLALDKKTEHDMWELRHAASPVLSRLDPKLKSMQFIEDGCVPPGRLAEYVRGVRAELARQDIRGVIFGHAGDAHMHVNPLVDVSAPDWRERINALLSAVTALVARLGGTVSGEHGDGRLRAPLLTQVWPAAALELFAELKTAFDPLHLLNPGAKVATAGEAPIEQVKYDPELPPISAAARSVLQRVESERAYSRNRLDMLRDALVR